MAHRSLIMYAFAKRKPAESQTFSKNPIGLLTLNLSSEKMITKPKPLETYRWIDEISGIWENDLALRVPERIRSLLLPSWSKKKLKLRHFELSCYIRQYIDPISIWVGIHILYLYILIWLIFDLPHTLGWLIGTLQNIPSIDVQNPSPPLWCRRTYVYIYIDIWINVNNLPSSTHVGLD